VDACEGQRLQGSNFGLFIFTDDLLSEFVARGRKFHLLVLLVHFVVLALLEVVRNLGCGNVLVGGAVACK